MATYFDTFETQTVGAAPAGWTSRWAALNPLVQQDGPLKVMQWNQAANARARYSHDAAGNFADGEVLAKMRLSAVPASGSSYAWVSGRISGAATSETAVSAYVGNNGNGLALALHQYSGGTTTALGELLLTGITVTSYFWVRFKFAGVNLFAKIWQDGQSEPGAWSITATNATVVAAGTTGVGGISGGAGIITRADYVGFATTAAEAAPAPIGKTAAITLRDAAGAALASVADLRWAWFDQVDPVLMTAPTSQGTASTDVTGLFAAIVTATSLSIGQTGALLIMSGDGANAGLYQVELGA